MRGGCLGGCISERTPQKLVEIGGVYRRGAHVRDKSGRTTEDEAVVLESLSGIIMLVAEPGRFFFPSAGIEIIVWPRRSAVRHRDGRCVAGYGFVVLRVAVARPVRLMCLTIVLAASVRALVTPVVMNTSMGFHQVLIVSAAEVSGMSAAYT